MDVFFEKDEQIVFTNILAVNDGVFTEGEIYTVVNFDSFTERVLVVDDMEVPVWVNAEAFSSADEMLI